MVYKDISDLKRSFVGTNAIVRNANGQTYPIAFSDNAVQSYAETLESSGDDVIIDALLDSEELILDSGRFQVPEGLFHPEAWGLDHPGVQKLVSRAIQECGVDIRKEMSRSIFLAGGVTMLPGFAERLEEEVNRLTPSGITPKVHASPYRYHAAYLGASEFASSPAFDQQRINLEDWKSIGPNVIRKWKT
ncbi:hypothetical protein QYM36_005847 [Artemia franciscana]|uniref:Actin n=1 Tax=Artemia franciscana TaxID=6661 RepID=A0AA88I2E9_ARTSF|nr:hypothetical protein QYM36_005847 [Artemia franciscana]